MRINTSAMRCASIFVGLLSILYSDEAQAQFGIPGPGIGGGGVNFSQNVTNSLRQGPAPAAMSGMAFDRARQESIRNDPKYLDPSAISADRGKRLSSYSDLLLSQKRKKQARNRGGSYSAASARESSEPNSAYGFQIPAGFRKLKRSRQENAGATPDANSRPAMSRSAGESPEGPGS
jgi:hypothetical protein